MDSELNDKNILSKIGFKNTKSRKTVIEILEKAGVPMAAEEIFLRAKEYGISINLSTVYRNLELMDNKGLVDKILMRDGKARYGLKDETHKHQLICTNCNRRVSIDCCPLQALEKDVGRETKFDITGHKLELYGVCPQCKEE